MTYENFLKVILKQQELDKQINKAYKLKIDLINFVDGYHKIIATLVKEIYGEDGYEWYSWFCYENDYGHKGIKAWDKYMNPICYSFESTWEYLEANHKTKSAKPVKVKEEREEGGDIDKLINTLMSDVVIEASYIYSKLKNKEVESKIKTEPFISLYDYQGHRDIKGVAKQLYKYAVSQGIKPQTREIENPKYKGIVYLYPRNIIENFFKIK